MITKEQSENIQRRIESIFPNWLTPAGAKKTGFADEFSKIAPDMFRESGWFGQGPIPPINVIQLLKATARAELLKRNKLFLKEWKAARSRNKVGWQDFCYRWLIDDAWSGDLNKLGLGSLLATQVFFRKRSGKVRSVPLETSFIVKNKGLCCIPQSRAERWAREVHKEPTFIYLRITPRTEFEALSAHWQAIKALKKELWGVPTHDKKKIERRGLQTFNRDLCFWDLRNNPKEFGSSPGQERLSWNKIAAKWREHNGKAIHRSVVIGAVKRIQGYINDIKPFAY